MDQSVFVLAESQPCRIALHVSHVKVSSIGAFYQRLPNQPNKKSSSACQMKRGDITLRCGKTDINFHHGHGEDGVFAGVFCAMLRLDV